MNPDSTKSSQGPAAPDGPPRPPRASAFALALAAAFTGAAVGGVAVWLWLRPAPAAAPPAAKAPEAPPAPKPLYQCPMHPAITADHPSDCPICGMKLVPVAAAGTAKPEAEARSGAGVPVPGLSAVTIDPARQQLIGLQTATAIREPIGAAWSTVGRVQVDPRRVRQINVKVEGYVERAFVDFVGQPVRKGEPLFSMYSPSLLAAQSEYLLAMKTRDALAEAGGSDGSGDALVASARRRLELWDVPPGAIEELERTGQPAKSLTLTSPISGVVTVKNLVEGARLAPGDAPYEITDLGSVWVMADAYEADLAKLRVDMPAAFTLKAYPGRVFSGRVAFLDPVLDPKTRTLKVHLHFANPGGELKPEMFGEVVLQGQEKQGLAIPADAVVRSGEIDVVFLALPGGRFEPREVKLGAKSGDRVEVRTGLEPGERVVTRANFLVDSESQLRASLSALGNSNR
jgi:Cu(I)/Ag(I) efflux system membrane fusion protein